MELNSLYVLMDEPGEDNHPDLLMMMSSPDHANLVSPDHEYVNNPSLPTAPAVPSPIESGVFSSLSNSSPTNTRFQFPSASSPTKIGEYLNLMSFLNTIRSKLKILFNYFKKLNFS